MCVDCSKKTIPVGPPGLPGINGTNGIDGINGINGINGTNGIDGVDGTNSFKFTKSFTETEIEQVLIITQAQLTACGAVPASCLADGTIADVLTNYHIQVYFDTGLYWTLLSPYATDPTFRVKIKVEKSTGNILIETFNTIGVFRVVITG